MSNPDGDEVMNSAQSHYIEVALGDISYEKNIWILAGWNGPKFGQQIEHLHWTANFAASCFDYQICFKFFECEQLHNSKLKL